MDIYIMKLSQYQTGISIIIFSIIFYFIFYTKPYYFFKEDGSIREFGLGYKEKTIFPIWIFSIILAIVSYLVAHIIVYYLLIRPI